MTVTSNLVLNAGTFPSNVTTLYISNNLNNTGNLLPSDINLTLQGTSFITFNCGNAIFNSINLAKSSSSTITPTGNCTTKDFTLTSGNVNNPASAYNLNITSDLVLDNDTSQNFGGANLSVILNGSSDQYITQSNVLFKSPLTISKSSGKAILLSNLITSNSQSCTISQGTLNLNGFDFVCSSTFTINTGATLEANGIEYFTAPTNQSQSSIIYTGSANSTIDYAALPSLSYKNLTVNLAENNDVLDSRNLLSNAIKGHWKMENGSGSVSDSSGQNNTATLNGNAAYSTTVPTLTDEINTYSIDLDGSGDYLNPGNNLNLLQNVKGATLTAWIRKRTNTSSDQIVGLSTGNSTSTSRVFMGTSTSTIECGARSLDSESVQTVTTNANVVTTNTWYHVACVVDYGKDKITIYVDGIPQLTDTLIDFSQGTTENTASQTSSIGIDEDKSGGDFDGQIDEVRIYSRPLSGREVSALYQGKTTSAIDTTLTVDGNFSLTSGTFYSPATLNISGNFSNTGTFTHNSGTIVLNGSNQTINGDTTFYNLTKATASTDTLTFQGNKTQIIANTLTLTGVSSNLLRLRSSSNGTQWNINPQGTRTIEYLDVKDSNNINASVIAVNGLNITDSLNNTNWGFESGEPAITLTPVSPDPTADTTPTVTGTATDADGTIALIEYQMDGTGSTWNSCTADDGSFNSNNENFTCDISPTLNHGNHTIYVRATDNAANVTPNEDAATDSFTVDITPPAITINTPTNPTNNATPTLTGNATDALSNVNNIQYQVDSTGGSWSNCSASDGNFNSSSENFSCTIVSTLSDGNHLIYFRGVDSLSNTTTNNDAASEDFDVDTTAPTVPGTPSATTPANDSTPTWQWNQSTDAIAGLSTITAYTMQWSKQSDFSSGVSSAQVGTNNCSLGICTYTTGSVSNGTWYFRVKATDTLGNESAYSSNGSRFIDTSAASITLTAISPDPTTDTTPTLTGSVTDGNSNISSVEYQMNSTSNSWSSCTSDDGLFDELTETFTCQVTSELTGGSHTIYTRATDASNNVTSNIIAHRDTFAVDISAPTITLTPYTPDPTADDTPTISGSATDSTATISNIQYQYDGTGGTWRNCTATDGAFDEATEEFTCTPNTGLSDGNHTIYVRATDSTGNTTTNGSASTDSFIVDTTYPSVSLTAISPDPTNDNTPTIIGTATDVTGTVSNVRYQVDATGGSWSNCTADDGVFDENIESFSCTPSSSLSDGSHTIYVQSIDALSNTMDVAHLASDAFVIDTTSAIITLDTIISVTDTTPEITGSVVDSLLTISNAQYQMDGTGGTWNSCTADDGTFDEANEDFTCNVSSPLNNGSHTVYVRVTDSDGKTTSNGAAETMIFVVDTTPPTISVNAVTPDPTSDTTPSITGTATDANALTAAVLLQIDGTGSTWTACTANDGTFDEASETFSCTAPSALSEGSHTFYLRGIDSLNNMTTSGYTTDTFVVSTTSPIITLGTVAPDPTSDTTPTLTGSAASTYSTVTNIQY
jgi:hypothetical protein